MFKLIGKKIFTFSTLTNNFTVKIFLTLTIQPRDIIIHHIVMLPFNQCISRFLQKLLLQNYRCYSHEKSTKRKFDLFDLILYVPSTIFQLYRDGSSWVEPVLS